MASAIQGAVYLDGRNSAPIQIFKNSSSTACPNSTARPIIRKASPLLLATPAATVATEEKDGLLWEVESRKHDLLRATQDTQRGLVATSDQRASIEEALVVLEGHCAGTRIDLAALDGTWRLQYTSASDVLVLLDSAARLPFFQVGQIFQKFECRDHSDEGIVRNVVRWSVPGLLEEEDGATLLVSAKFSVISSRNIFLLFDEITVHNFNISEAMQALIAPAILPRSVFNLQMLQFIRTFSARFPVRSIRGGSSVGGLYYLSYLDNNMLLGRALVGGGVFLFTKAQPLP